jgi:hypothetical protein
MADKLQQGVNVLTTFVEGETPSAAKLNSITAQLKNVSQQLERAVGDIHGQSYPYSSSTAERLTIAYGRSGLLALSGAESRSLDIANLARLIGPASALNPQVLAGDFEVTEPVPNSVTEFSLRYPPESVAGVSFSKSGVGEAFENVQTISTLAAAGDYYVDSLGRVFCTQETDATDAGTVTYTVNRNSWFGGAQYMGSRFNVIPGPNQLSSGGNGCSIGSPDAQGRRAITLPTVTHAQFNELMDSVSLDAADPSYGEQLLLPGVLTGSYTAGEIIPEGFVLLKNWTTGEVYDEAEYTYNTSSTLYIGAVDITTEVDRGDVFCLITVGTDITTSIDDLRRKSRHGHDRTFGEPLVPADAITDWTAGPWGSKGSFTVSEIEGNYAPQYLHRYGYQSGENDWNDQNIMRGHLVLGKSGATEGGYLDSSGFSYSIYFGDLSGPRLYNSATSFYLDSNGGCYLDAATSGRFEAAAGDLNLRSLGGNINLYGGTEVNNWAGINYATDTHVADVSFRMNEAVGNMSHTSSASVGDSIAAGPIHTYHTSGLPLWAIDETGSTGGTSGSGTSNGTGSNHYATTTTEGSYDSGSPDKGWVVPAFQVIHYAQWNKNFQPYDSSGAGSPTWSNVAFWQTNIKLPEFLYDEYANNLGGNAVIGMSVMVKSSDVNSRWWSTGGSARYGTDNGERVIAYLDFSSAVSSDNEIQIIIGADGNTGQNFHYSRFQGGDANGDPASNIDVDVKITLFVAAATDSVIGINNVIP